jgi:hypothetical protein
MQHEDLHAELCSPCYTLLAATLLIQSCLKLAEPPWQCPLLWLMCVGLCDAHVHCTAVTANLPGLLSLPESLVTARSSDILEGMLSRGFTTIRDAGNYPLGR